MTAARRPAENQAGRCFQPEYAGITFCRKPALHDLHEAVHEGILRRNRVAIAGGNFRQPFCFQMEGNGQRLAQC